MKIDLCVAGHSSPRTQGLYSGCAQYAQKRGKRMQKRIKSSFLIALALCTGFALTNPALANPGKGSSSTYVEWTYQPTNAQSVEWTYQPTNAQPVEWTYQPGQGTRTQQTRNSGYTSPSTTQGTYSQSYPQSSPPGYGRYTAPSGNY